MVDCCLDLAANRQGSSSAGYGQKPKLPQPAAAVGGNNNSSTTAHTTFGGTFVYWANKATSILFNQAEMCTKLRLNCATTKDATPALPSPRLPCGMCNPFQHPQNGAQNFDNEIGENEKLSV